MGYGQAGGMLSVRRTGRVMVVSVDNPPVNFLTSGVMRDLDSLLDRIAHDADIGAVVITGGLPGIFVTHFDVDEIRALAGDLKLPVGARTAALAARAESLLSRLPGARALVDRTPLSGIVAVNRFHEVCARLRAMDKVFIAAINGRALGGGLELALACDLRLVARSTPAAEVLLGQPEILIGLIPGGGGTQALTRLVGAAKSLELCLDGTLLTPEQALALGLANRLCAPDALLDEAVRWGETLARRSPRAVGALKRAIHSGASRDLDAGMAVEKAEFMSAATQRSTRAAMLAYADDVASCIAAEGDISAASLQPWITGSAFDFSGRR